MQCPGVDEFEVAIDRDFEQSEFHSPAGLAEPGHHRENIHPLVLPLFGGVDSHAEGTSMRQLRPWLVPSGEKHAPRGLESTRGGKKLIYMSLASYQLGAKRGMGPLPGLSAGTRYCLRRFS